MPCKAVRKSVVSDQIWIVRNEPGNGDAGTHAGSPALSVGTVYLPHLHVSSCQTPSQVAFQHPTGIAHATM